MRDCISIPTITAGLPLSLSLSLGAQGIDADTYTVTLYLRGPKAVDVVATGSGTTFEFSADAAATAAWTPGAYWWTVRADDGAGLVRELDAGQTEVVADLVAAGDGYDGRTENQKALDAIDAVIANRATLDQERYRINNRELYRTPIRDLIALRSYYANKVRQERKCCKGASGFGRAVLVKFKS